MTPYPPSDPGPPVTIRLRRSLLFAVLWAFGLATTLLLIGAWGRVTSADQTAIGDTAAAVIGTEEVSTRVTDWLAGGLAEATRLSDADVRTALAELQESPQARGATDQIVRAAVAALLAGPGESTEIDIGSVLAPLAPLIAAELTERGTAVGAAEITTALSAVGPIALDTAEAGSFAATAARVEGFLTVVVVMAATALVVLGGVAVGLAEERVKMVRNLATRVALSAISFALLFRIGGWVLDPGGGRSPVMAGGSVLVRANGQIFVILGAGAGVLAAGISWYLSRRRLPVPPLDDDTRELVAV